MWPMIFAPAAIRSTSLEKAVANRQVSTLRGIFAHGYSVKFRYQFCYQIIRKYLSTTALFWTTGGGLAGRFEIADRASVIANASLACRKSPWRPKAATT
jgi:hypothetical protein